MSDATDGGPRLIAYHRGARPEMEIVPASRWREWMDRTHARNANRCLPLLAANEFGWVLLAQKGFSATWSGDPRPDSLTIAYDGPPPKHRAESNFGYGIVTFRVPYLFRTPPGWDLLVRGPTNEPKDGVAPLDAVVETDWAMATFTMNWKLTRAGTVQFEDDEPFCMIVPQRRHDLTSFRAELRPVADDADADEQWSLYDRRRDDLKLRKFLAVHTPGMGDVRAEWQSEYFKGRRPDGGQAPEHITKRRVDPFGEPAA